MIVHYRLEDTFIQGVLTTYVFAHHPCDGILIVDDDLLGDESLRKLIKLSVSPKIKIFFFGYNDCLVNLEKAENSSQNYYVIQRNPITAHQLIQKGYVYKLPIICGLQAVREGTIQIMKGVALTDDEAEAVDLLIESGVKVLFDPAGIDKNVPWEKLRKAYYNIKKEEDSSTVSNKNTSLQKTLLILECFLDDNRAKLTLSEIQKDTQIPFSTCYRLTVFLQESGYLDKDEKTAEYSLGWKLIKFAQSYSDASQKALLKDISPYYLKHLQTKYNETVSLFVRTGMRQMCILSFPSLYSLQVCNPIDVLVDIQSDAPGLVLLSSIKKNGVMKRVDEQQDFKALLAKVRKDGYAVTFSEDGEGIRSISAPILDSKKEVVAALTVQGPSCRFTSSGIEDKILDVKDAASKISSELMLALRK